MTIFFATMISLVLLAPARAEPVSAIQSRVLQPICPRGSVLMLPLAAQQAGDRWPQSLDLTLASGEKITGPVAWVYPAPPSLQRNWTDDPRGFAIRAVLASDDSSQIDSAAAPGFGPYLLVRLPLDGNGDLILGAQSLQPTWRDVPNLESIRINDDDRQPSSDRAELPLIPAPDRPDPVSPFEYWRWTLLADRLKLDPPDPFGGDIERLAAECTAALWRIGLERLHSQSPRIAQECRHMLTQTGIERRQTFAAWIADPISCDSLLRRLLDFSTLDSAALSAAVDWLDQQPPLFLWKEMESADHVRLNIITPRSEPLLTSFSWPGVDQPAMSVQIEPGVLTQLDIARPTPAKSALLDMRPATEPVRQVLQVEALGRRIEITLSPQEIVVKPPGIFFQPLAPPLTLAQVQGSPTPAHPIDRATFTQVRRLSGRWEIFFECRRLAVDKPPSDDGHAVPEELRSFDDLRGSEAATLLLGPPESPTVWLTVPEFGFHRVVRGSADSTLQIHKTSRGDRWYCRVVLPESWFSAHHTRPALIGAIRSHRDSAQLETGPGLSLPWRPNPSRVALNLDEWDDLPRGD